MYNEIEALVEARREQLYKRLQELKDVWTDMRDEAYGNGENGSLQLRVRKTARGTIEAVWYRLRHFETASGTKKSSTMYAKGTKHRYPASAFKHCKAWEKAIVEELEPHLAAVREELSYLAKAKKSLSFAKQATSEDRYKKHAFTAKDDR